MTTGAARMIEGDGAEPRLTHVHVHLDHGRSPASWNARFARGEVQEPYPYGYDLAGEDVDLTASADAPERPVGRLLRRAVLRLVGADVVHAWRNRRAIGGADAVWTHTEREHLAIALLIRLRAIPRVPVVGQSIWLWDRLEAVGPVRRRSLRWLLGSIAAHTVHSPENMAVGTRLLGRDVLLVPYGTAPLPPAPRPALGPRLRVLAPGNDRDRDWTGLVEAARLAPDLEVRVVTRAAAPQHAPPNVHWIADGDARSMRQEYAACDVVAVPLHPNLHASGLTVCLEAIRTGRPLAVTRTGGLDAYFGDDVEWAVVDDARSLARAIRRAAERPDVEAARRRAAERGLTAADYAHRHVLLTEALLRQEPVPPSVSAFARPGSIDAASE